MNPMWTDIMTDIHDWKHQLTVASLAGSNSVFDKRTRQNFGSETNQFQPSPSSAIWDICDHPSVYMDFYPNYTKTDWQSNTFLIALNIFNLRHQISPFVKNTTGKSFIFERHIFFSVEYNISGKSRVFTDLWKSCGSLRRVNAYQYDAGLEAKNKGTTTIQKYYQTLLLRYHSGTGGN